jgi:hypothetical protein
VTSFKVQEKHWQARWHPLMTVSKIYLMPYQTHPRTKQLFVLTLAMLTYAVLGVCPECCHAANEEAAPTKLRYEVDTSQLPANIRIDLSSIIITVAERLGGKAKVRALNGNSIEVLLEGEFDEPELDSLKRRITTLGPVSFARYVIGTDPNARRVIDAALDVPLAKFEVILKGRSVAKWVPVYSTNFDPTFLLDSNIVTRTNNSHTELIVWNDAGPLTGDYILSSKKAFDDKGMVGIVFEFNKDGAKILRRLTIDDTERKISRQVLGLFIDNRAYSGTVIKEQLDSRLFIGSLPEHEIDSILSILNAGALPYPLKEKK